MAGVHIRQTKAPYKKATRLRVAFEFIG